MVRAFQMGIDMVLGAAVYVQDERLSGHLSHHLRSVDALAPERENERVVGAVIEDAAEGAPQGHALSGRALVKASDAPVCDLLNGHCERINQLVTRTIPLVRHLRRWSLHDEHMQRAHGRRKQRTLGETT